MEIRPIVSSLLRSRTGPLLVALQVAISLAILANALFVVQQRVAVSQRPSGVPQTNRTWATSSSGRSRCCRTRRRSRRTNASATR
jgi:putative ABC transport system permease protein